MNVLISLAVLSVVINKVTVLNPSFKEFIKVNGTLFTGSTAFFMFRQPVISKNMV